MKKTFKKLVAALLVLTLIVVCPGAVNKAKAADNETLVSDTVTIFAGGSKGYSFNVTKDGTLYMDFLTDTKMDLTITYKKTSGTTFSNSAVIKESEWEDAATALGSDEYSGYYVSV